MRKMVHILASFIALMALVVSVHTPAAFAEPANYRQPAANPQPGTFIAKDGSTCREVAPAHEGTPKKVRCVKVKKASANVLKEKFKDALSKERKGPGMARDPGGPDRFCPPEDLEGGTVGHLSRVSVCSAVQIEASEITGNPPVTVGGITLYSWQWIDFNRSTLAWNHDAFITADQEWGTLQNGISVEFSTICAAGGGSPCNVYQSDVDPEERFHLSSGNAWQLNWQEMLDNPPLPGYQFAVPLSGWLGYIISWIDVGSDVTKLHIQDDGSADGEDAVYLTGRCDNNDGPNSTNRGCVNHGFIPILEYDSRPDATPLVREVAQHIYDNQVSPTWLPSRWGIPAYGHALTRSQDSQVERLNRQAACGTFVPSYPGEECDEWPLATTDQGAHFSGPLDSSARGVPSQANQSQGGTTSRFYDTNRLIHGDDFWVRAILPDGRRSW
jgi:hypothetical protein